MIFFEKMSVWDYLYHALRKDHCLYLDRSRFIPLTQRLFKLSSPHINKVGFNCIEYMPGIRRNAYARAFDMVQAIELDKWNEKMSELFGLDFQLHAKKFFFDKFYLRSEFVEIARRFCIENPQKKVSIHLSARYLDRDFEDFSGFSKIRVRRSVPFLSFIFSLFLCLPTLYYQKRTNASNDNLFFENTIVCLVDDMTTLNMFVSLFGNFSNLAFVTEKHNRSWFPDDVVKKYNISVLGLGAEDISFFKSRIGGFIMKTMVSQQAMKHGSACLELLNLVIRGRSQAIKGSNNVMTTYEHLETVKAIRNDFLHQRNTMTVFIPKNAYISTQYFHSEIYINYKVMCAAGQHTIDLLKKKKAYTNFFLPTGSYDNHRNMIPNESSQERIEKLQAFKGSKCVVTILSPGICDPTYRHEVKLMLLAQQLSQLENVLVFIRTKPVLPESKYRDFYTSYTKGYPGILLTDKEFALMDFLPVTDLFITSMSNSASDLALCGGQVYYIDFLKDPELFLSWEKVPEVLINEQAAFDRIKAWIDDVPGVDERSRLKKNMGSLLDYIGYRYKDFDSYKNNLIQQLRPLLPLKKEV